jgi:hypothetical protein
MIGHKHKFIFTQIPKTGCTSVEKSLQKYGEPVIEGRKLFEDFRYKHASISTIKKHIPVDQFDNYFKFTIVRNPYGWLVSNYFFWCRGIHGCYLKHLPSVQNHPGLRYFLDLYNLMSMDFKTWVNWYAHNVRGTQLELITDGTGQVIVDYIGRFENLKESHETICNRLNIPTPELPHVNQSKHKHYTEYYDDETRQIVAEKYAKDIEYFGYEFGE